MDGELMVNWWCWVLFRRVHLVGQIDCRRKQFGIQQNYRTTKSRQRKGQVTKQFSDQVTSKQTSSSEADKQASRRSKDKHNSQADNQRTKPPTKQPNRLAFSQAKRAQVAQFTYLDDDRPRPQRKGASKDVHRLASSIFSFPRYGGFL